MTPTEYRLNYIKELRSMLPELQDWWEDLITKSDRRDVETRWPTGLAGHPRILAVFRKYFILIEEYYNLLPPDEELLEPPAEELWGNDASDEIVDRQRPAEWLIFDMRSVAPDLIELVDGLCFVPIGMVEDP